jgi:hypothetical protein
MMAATKGHPRVRSVVAGAFGTQAEELIRAHFQRKARGRTDVLE